MELRWRALRTSDLHSWSHLLESIEEVDRRGENFGLEDLAVQLAACTGPDSAGDSLAAFHADRLVAYGVIRPRGGHGSRGGYGGEHAVVDGGVAPDLRRQGLGRAVVGWFEQWAAARAAAAGHGVTLHSRVSDRNPAHALTILERGFEPECWFTDLERDLPADISQDPISQNPKTRHAVSRDSVWTGKIIPYSGELAEPARVVWNDAFSSSPGNPQHTADSWHRATSAPSFRPESSFLARDASGAVVGVLLADHYPTDTERTGVREAWITGVGSRRSARGTGVVDALLTHAGRAHAEQGYQRAALSVRSDEPAPQLDVYEQAGFRRAHVWAGYARTFSAS